MGRALKLCGSRGRHAVAQFFSFGVGLGWVGWIDVACCALGTEFRIGISCGQSWQLGVTGVVDNMLGALNDRVDICLQILVDGQRFLVDSGLPHPIAL
jgi:hypothetical protein